MPDFELRDPVFLLAAALAPIVWWRWQRSSGRVSYSSVALVDAAPVSLRARLAFLPGALLALAVALLAIALAGPRTGDATTLVRREGIAIALVVDRSGSMDARDFVENDSGVSRLHAVKGIVRNFVLGGDDLPGRPDDLIGLVGFARYPDALAPLTLDHANLVAILEDMEIARERSEDGTSIGEGLALAVERLRRHPAASKVAILLTDGVNNSGDLEPGQAAQLAAGQGIRVYAIGAGRSGLAPVPVRGLDGRMHLQRMRVQLDEETLREIAERTDGRYFHADSAEALAEVYAEIDRLERTELSEVRYLQYDEHYAGFTLAGLLCASLAWLGSASVLRRLP